MQVNIGINNELALFGGRALIRTTPYQPIVTYKLNKKTKVERKGKIGMAHFGDIAKEFNTYVLDLVNRKKIKNQNGLYLRTLMLFMAYANTHSKERTVSNAISYLDNKLNFIANSATVSRNNDVLTQLGLIKLVEDPNDARAKIVELTPVGEKFAKLMR